MSLFLKSIYRLVLIFGIDPRRTLLSIKGLPTYVNNYYSLKKQKANSNHEFNFGFPFPCLTERFTDSGSAKGHYFHQDLLVARRVFEERPNCHVDIGSRVDGLVAHIASFRKINVFDIRPLHSDIDNINFIQTDLMAEIDEKLYGYCDSLSCLHAIEHFGLGRYGDQVNYYGYKLGINNIHKILKQNGKLYVSVPIGPQRIEFDAHRVFSINHFLELFSENFDIDQFSYVDDKGDLHENVMITEDNIKNDYGCVYGCGIFEMTKKT